MLVFRCECEQVLGVENESTKGGLGECPSCGRIIRVPMGLVDAAGRLRVTAPPQRASGAYRLIKDVKPEPKNGIGSGLSAAVPPVPPAAPAPQPPAKFPEPTVLSEDLEPETLAPLTESSLNRPITDSSAVETLGEAAAEPQPPQPKPEPQPPSASGRKDSLSKKSSRIAPVAPPQADPDSDPDAAAATESRSDRTLGPAATALARRRRSEAAAAETKKSPLTLYLLIGAILVVIVAVLWLAGLFSGAPKSNTVSPATTSTSTDTKPETKSADTTEKKADATPETEKKDNK